MPLIYHIADANAWQRAQENGRYNHSSLAAEGFIHASTKEQLQNTANRYFKLDPEIIVLYIEEDNVDEAIRYEPATGGDLYPHIYGTLNIEAVTQTRVFKRDADGTFHIDL